MPPKRTASNMAHDQGMRAFLEWCDYEGIGVPEWVILNQLTDFGITAISNALYHLGWAQGWGTLKALLQAAFQLGRAVGRNEERS